MPNQPNQNQFHLDSTSLGSELTTTWVEEPNAFDEATVHQLEAAAECREALGELFEVLLNWLTYLSCWTGNKLYPMTSNHCDSLVEKLGTQTVRALASLETLEKADQEVEQALAEIEVDSVEHLKHYWVKEESEPSAEPIKGAALEENPLLIPPKLAATIGLHEATVLNQIQYWLNKGVGELINGIRWIWNTLDDWLNQFPFLSKWELRKALRRLRDDLGLLEFSQKQKHRWDRTGWYTINYKRLKALQLSMCGPPHVDVCPPTDRCVTVHTSRGTETTPETSSEITATPTAAILNFGEEQVDKVTQVNSLLDQEERESTGVVPKTPDQDNFPGAASDSVKKLVEQAEIPLNPQLKSTLANYTLEQVAAAVYHYRSVSRKGRLKNPAGWLTDCLKGQWWIGTERSATEVIHPASRVYTVADFEVERSPVPQSFKDMMAGLTKKLSLRPPASCL